MDANEKQLAERREPIILQMTAPAATTGTLEYNFRRPCTIERIFTRFYQGQQRNLQVTPWIRTPNGVLDRLFKVDAAGLADTFLAGNDDVLELDIVRPVASHSELVLAWENIHAAEDYTLYWIIEIDYRAGLSSWGGGGR